MSKVFHFFAGKPHIVSRSRTLAETEENLIRARKIQGMIDVKLGQENRGNREKRTAFSR
jgi:hypothetical protein